MSKYFITEEQMQVFIEQVGEEVLDHDKVRAHMFDWDDNILNMPTKIKMDKNVGGKWQPVDVSTEEFRDLRNDSNYKLRGDSPEVAFEDFRNDGAFIRDIKVALQDLETSKAGSYDKFIESVKYANPFAIITARGHSPQGLKKGTEFLIKSVMSEQDLGVMVDNIKRRYDKYPAIHLANDNDLISLYLDNQTYHPVSSYEFQDKFGGEGIDASNPEVGKQIAIEHFVDKVMSTVMDVIEKGKDVQNISFGFSDDDIGNVKIAEKLIEDKLNHMYPGVKFIVYDTSDEENVIKIKKY